MAPLTMEALYSRTPVNLATRMALDAFNVALAKDLRINIREQACGHTAFLLASRLILRPKISSFAGFYLSTRTT
ncbi:hypothetical protein ACNKHM_27345 [Shigella sonnei]